MQECGHLLDILLEVTQIYQPGRDDVIRHLDVLVHEDIAEADGLPQWRRTLGS